MQFEYWVGVDGLDERDGCLKAHTAAVAVVNGDEYVTHTHAVRAGLASLVKLQRNASYWNAWTLYHNSL